MRFATLLLALFLALPALAQDGQPVYVVSQGAFGSNNADVVRIGLDGARTVVQSGRPVTQGAQIIDGRLYLTAGSTPSGSRVDVIDLATGRQVAQVASGLDDPRYLAEVSPGVAFVTNGSFQTDGDPFVAVLDLATNTVTGTIPVPTLPEGIAAVGNRAYAALGAFGGPDSLAVFDVAARSLVGYVDIGCGARLVFEDADGEVLAVCPDAVVVVDGATGGVVARVAAPAPIQVGFAQEAAFDARTQTLVALADASGDDEADPVVLRFDAATNTFGESIDIDGVAPSAVGVDGRAGRVYLGRPNADNPFSAAGTVSVVTFDGEEAAEYAAGVYPSYVAVAGQGGPVATERGAGRGGLALALAGPNPARGRTALAVTLDRPARATVTLYDVLGRPALVLDGGALTAGTHRLDLDVSALPAGLYLVRLVSEGGVADVAVTVAR